MKNIENQTVSLTNEILTQAMCQVLETQKTLITAIDTLQQDHNSLKTKISKLEEETALYKACENNKHSMIGHLVMKQEMNELEF